MSFMVGFNSPMLEARAPVSNHVVSAVKNGEGHDLLQDGSA